MSKLPKILLLLVLMGTVATSQVQRPGPARPAPVLGNPGPAIGSLDELKQYTAGGHILGFRKGEMFVASGDHALNVEFVSANPVSPIGEGGSANPKKGHDVAPPLGRVTYRDRWDGVTLVYENRGGGVAKSSYHVEASGIKAVDRVDQIWLRYNVPVKVDEVGDLILSFKTGEMRESRPVAWQEIGGNRVPAEVTYRLRGGREIGFKAGSYDSQYPLEIDLVLSWNTFLGGSGYDYGYGIAVDTSGNVYVTGKSGLTWGSPVRPYAGYLDVFVAKVKEVEGYNLTIASGPHGATSPLPGTYFYNAGSNASVSAVADSGYTFDRWTGDVPAGQETSATVSIPMTADKSIQANFIKAVKPPLSLTGERMVNRNVSMVEYVARLRWEANGANTGTITYRIYQIVNSQATKVADIGAGTHEYLVRKLQKTKSYQFGVTAVNSMGWESDMVSVTIQ